MKDQPTFNPPVKHRPESYRRLQLGPLLVMYRFSSDTNDKLWGHTEPSGKTRVRHLISLHYLEASDGCKVWGAYIVSLCLYWTWRQ
jgi:hypothetical protein